jgi:hypothetical protein
MIEIGDERHGDFVHELSYMRFGGVENETAESDKTNGDI